MSDDVPYEWKVHASDVKLGVGHLWPVKNEGTAVAACKHTRRRPTFKNHVGAMFRCFKCESIAEEGSVDVQETIPF